MCLIINHFKNKNMNTKEFENELEALFEREIELREQFRSKRKELEDLVQVIQNHVGNCNQFWTKNIPDDVESFVVIRKNGKAHKINPPDKDKCYVESYLPFGIDFSDATVFNCT